jgi:hypothetical protein
MKESVDKSMVLNTGMAEWGSAMVSKQRDEKPAFELMLGARRIVIYANGHVDVDGLSRGERCVVVNRVPQLFQRAAERAARAGPLRPAESRG